MRRLTSIMLLCLPLFVYAVEPEVRVQSRLVPADSALVGSTVNLEVDVLVDTWFTAAPILPKLDLPGAVVSPPGSEALHLTERQDGKTFFGLRFVYQITPQTAQRFDIPGLDIHVQPGQASGPMTVQSQPLNFVARALAGGVGDSRGLVARTVTFTQEIERSHDPLREGDSVTRRLRLEAEGAQAMLIPPPRLVEIKGLKRYLQTRVMPLNDGRGTTTGGMREDTVTYVISEAGPLTLPAIDVHWWDADTGEARSISVPQVTFEAAKGTYQAPFSISEDLRALGQKARMKISGHWLVLATALLLGGALVYVGRPWLHGAWAWLQRWKTERHQAWLDSADYAWKQARLQADTRPLQLGALYLWIRRGTGHLTISSLFPLLPDAYTNRLLAFFDACYAQRPSPDDPAGNLAQALPAMRQVVVEQQKRSCLRRHGLKPLNT